jgi:uncharacterized protein DUF3175
MWSRWRRASATSAEFESLAGIGSGIPDLGNSDILDLRSRAAGGLGRDFFLRRTEQQSFHLLRHSGFGIANASETGMANIQTRTAAGRGKKASGTKPTPPESSRKASSRKASPRKASSRKASPRKASPRKTGARSSKPVKKWSQHVTETSDAMTLADSVFKLRSPRAIAASLKRSAENSDRRKSTPYRSAISMLTFYINRGGRNLSPAQHKKLESAKNELRSLFGRDTARS